MLPTRESLGVCHHGNKVLSDGWAVAQSWAHAGSDFVRQEGYLLIHPTSSRGRCLYRMSASGPVSVRGIPRHELAIASLTSEGLSGLRCHTEVPRRVERRCNPRLWVCLVARYIGILRKPCSPPGHIARGYELGHLLILRTWSRGR